MVILFDILIFIIGASVGSFLGVVVDRLASKEPIWRGRSHCDHCRHNLAAIDLIPFLSYFLLKRECRYCHKKLSWFYPLIEFLTGLSYLLIFLVVFQQSKVLLMQVHYYVLTLYYFSLISALLAIFFADLRYGIIPFKLVIFALLITLVWDILFPHIAFSSLEIQLLGLQTNLLTVLASAVGASGFFLFLFLVTKGKGMGFGDVVYALLMGAILGFPRVVLGLYIAFVTGAIVSLVLIVLKKKKLHGGTIPFGPFLVFGTFVSLLWGTQLITFLLATLTA